MSGCLLEMISAIFLSSSTCFQDYAHVIHMQGGDQSASLESQTGIDKRPIRNSLIRNSSTGQCVNLYRDTDNRNDKSIDGQLRRLGANGMMVTVTRRWSPTIKNTEYRNATRSPY